MNGWILHEWEKPQGDELVDRSNGFIQLQVGFEPRRMSRNVTYT